MSVVYGDVLCVPRDSVDGAKQSLKHSLTNSIRQDGLNVDDYTFEFIVSENARKGIGEIISFSRHFDVTVACKAMIRTSAEREAQ